MHFNAIQTQRRLQSVLAKKEEERQRRLAAKRAAEEEKAAELRAAELRAKRAKRAARVRAHQVAAVVAIFECDPDKGCTRETIAKYVKEGELVMLEDEPGRNGFATAALREALDDGMSAGAFVLAPKAGRIRVADIPEDWSVHEKYRKELMRRKVCMSRLSACLLARFVWRWPLPIALGFLCFGFGDNGANARLCLLFGCFPFTLGTCHVQTTTATMTTTVDVAMPLDGHCSCCILRIFHISGVPYRQQLASKATTTDGDASTTERMCQTLARHGCEIALLLLLFLGGMVEAVQDFVRILLKKDTTICACQRLRVAARLPHNHHTSLLLLPFAHVCALHRFS